MGKLLASPAGEVSCVTNASRSFSLSLSLLNSFYTKIGTEPALIGLPAE
jgi:hypothetical protein